MTQDTRNFIAIVWLLAAMFTDTVTFGVWLVGVILWYCIMSPARSYR